MYLNETQLGIAIKITNIKGDQIIPRVLKCECMSYIRIEYIFICLEQNIFLCLCAPQWTKFSKHCKTQQKNWLPQTPKSIIFFKTGVKWQKKLFLINYFALFLFHFHCDHASDLFRQRKGSGKFFHEGEITKNVNCWSTLQLLTT